MENQSHKKKIRLNIISTIVCQVITIGIGFVLPLIYIENFGSETNGVLSVIKQIFTYLALLEAGIGTASAQALYKPVANGEKDNINGILAATKFFYARTGVIYTIVVSIIAFGYGAYAYFAGLEIQWYTVVLLVLLNALPSLIAYFIQLKYQVFLEIDGRQYVLTNSQAVLQIVSGFAKVAVILLTNSLVLMQLTYALCAIAQLIYVTIYTRKKYPWLNFKVEQNRTALSQKGSVLIHQITSMIFNNTDIILLSFLCNPVVSSIYYIYNLFFSQVELFITGIIRGFNFALGQLFATDREKFDTEFNVYEMVFSAANFLVYTLMATFLLPIIRMYTKHERDGVIYVFPVVLLLFALSKMISCVKTPCNQVNEYYGAFTKTRWIAITEAVLNVITTVGCTIWFYKLWGNGGAICGALAGTIVASVFRTIAVVIFTNTVILKRNPLRSFEHLLVNGVVYGFVFFLYGTDHFTQMDFGPLVLHGIVNAIWITAAYALVNFAAHPKMSKYFIREAKKFIKKKLKKA